MTFIKHVLARKRVLIYTHPSAEMACEIAIAGAEICFGSKGSALPFDAPTILGMVGLIDMDRIKAESTRGYGWIACKYSLHHSPSYRINLLQ